MQSRFMKFALAVSVVMFALAGCGGNDGDDNNNPENSGGDNSTQTPGGNGGGGDNNTNNNSLVGDWKLVESTYIGISGYSNTDTYGDSENFIHSFSSPNKLKATIFEKLGDFWIESSIDFSGTWSTDGQKLYLNSNGHIDSMQYSISNNILTLTETTSYCNGAYTTTEIMKFTKSTVAALKNSLGTVRTQDNRLYGSIWRLTSEDYGRLEYGISYFYYDGQRYFKNTDGMGSGYGHGYWYTSGSDLSFVDVDWECLDDNCSDQTIIVKETVQFTYALGTSNGIKTLTLTNSAKGINDVWEFEYDNFQNYNSWNFTMKNSSSPSCPPESNRPQETIPLAKSKQSGTIKSKVADPFWTR